MGTLSYRARDLDPAWRAVIESQYPDAFKKPREPDHGTGPPKARTAAGEYRNAQMPTFAIPPEFEAKMRQHEADRLAMRYKQAEFDARLKAFAAAHPAPPAARADQNQVKLGLEDARALLAGRTIQKPAAAVLAKPRPEIRPPIATRKPIERNFQQKAQRVRGLGTLPRPTSPTGRSNRGGYSRGGYGMIGRIGAGTIFGVSPWIWAIFTFFGTLVLMSSIH